MFRPIIRFAGWFIPMLALVLGFSTVVENFAQPNRPGTDNTATQCGALVQAALSSTDTQCSDTSRNQACYGHVLNEAVSRPEVEAFVFDERGDKVLLHDVVSIDLSPLELADELWGVVLMQVQANLPDALPGQNVTFILFGDVQVENAVGTPVEREATVVSAANIRIAPGEGRPVLASLASGQTIITNGKTMTSAGEVWVRVNHDPDRETYGWMLSDLLNVDLSELPDVEASDQTVNPMQAFYFKTGIGAPQCVEAPEDGILVQTPNGVGMVNFSVNGMDIGLGSTAYLTAPEEDGLSCVYLLEGESDVTAMDESVELEPGFVTCVELDDEGIAASVPSEPVLYDPTKIDKLIDLLPLLPEDIELPEITATATPTSTNTPRPYVPPRATNTPTPTNLPPQPQQPAPTTAPTATSTPTVTPLPDCSGGESETVEPCRPVADFNFYVVSDLTVQFYDNSYGNVNGLFWEFGDGSTSTDYSPQHTYNAPGIYTVRLRVENEYAVDRARQDVVLTSGTPIPPNASFSQSVDVFTLTYADTSNPGDASITIWQWSFGDGNTSSSPSGTHTYASGGSYDITLVVTDANGQSSTSIVPIFIGDCNYSLTQSTTLAVNFDTGNNAPSDQFNIGLKAPDCTLLTPTILTSTSGPVSQTIQTGQHFYIQQIVPCSQLIHEGIAGTTPINLPATENCP